MLALIDLDKLSFSFYKIFNHEISYLQIILVQCFNRVFNHIEVSLVLVEVLIIWPEENWERDKVVDRLILRKVWLFLISSTTIESMTTCPISMYKPLKSKH